MGKVNLDDVIEKIGGCGRYQILMNLIIHSMKCIMCFSMIFMLFGAAVPDWWCVDDFEGQNATETVYSYNSSRYKSCKSANGTKDCSKFVFDSSIRTTISEWNLVCGLDWVPQTITSLQMFGVLVGNVACGQVADMVGRKPPLFGAILALVILNVIAIFSVSWIMMAVIRFFIGICMGFQVTVQYNLMSEFTLARWRSLVIAIPSWAIELALFALVAWLCGDWQYLLVVTVAVGAPLLLTLRFVPESFRWYVAHDRMSDAENVIKHVAYINKKPVPETEQLRDLMTTEMNDTTGTTDKKYSFYDILKNKRLFIYTLSLGFIWMTLGLGGYGIQFGITSLSGNLYINIFVIAMFASPLQFICMWLQNRIGRKKTIALCYSVFCITAFIVGIAQQLDESGVKDKLTSVTALISLIAINAAWSPVQTITIETYPTVVRNIGYGIQNSMARVGAIIGPQLVFLDSKVTGLMFFVCGVAAILSMVMLIPLRETRGADLHDKILQEESSIISKESELDTKIDEQSVIV